MLELILRNKEWLFSGIGVVVLLGLARIVISRIRANRQGSLSEFEDKERGARASQWLSFGTRPAINTFELLPISFMIDLLQTLPYIEIRYYAVNYLTRELHLRDATVSTFNLSSSPIFERIPLAQEFKLPPQSTTMVIFRRSLTDSEARVLGKEGQPYPRTASFSLLARAKERNEELTYGPVASMWIEGWINRPAV